MRVRFCRIHPLGSPLSRCPRYQNGKQDFRSRRQKKCYRQWEKNYSSSRRYKLDHGSTFQTTASTVFGWLGVSQLQSRKQFHNRRNSQAQKTESNLYIKQRKPKKKRKEKKKRGPTADPNTFPILYKGPSHGYYAHIVDDSLGKEIEVLGFRNLQWSCP